MLIAEVHNISKVHKNVIFKILDKLLAFLYHRVRIISMRGINSVGRVPS